MNEEEFMSDIKDETSVDIDTAEKSVDMIKDYYNNIVQFIKYMM